MPATAAVISILKCAKVQSPKLHTRMHFLPFCCTKVLLAVTSIRDINALFIVVVVVAVVVIIHCEKYSMFVDGDKKKKKKNNNNNPNKFKLLPFEVKIDVVMLTKV